MSQLTNHVLEEEFPVFEKIFSLPFSELPGCVFRRPRDSKVIDDASKNMVNLGEVASSIEHEIDRHANMHYSCGGDHYKTLQSTEFRLCELLNQFSTSLLDLDESNV